MPIQNRHATDSREHGKRSVGTAAGAWVDDLRKGPAVGVRIGLS